MEDKVKICPNCSEIMERRSEYFYTCDKCMSYHNTDAFPQLFGINPLSPDGPKYINHDNTKPLFDWETKITWNTPEQDSELGEAGI